MLRASDEVERGEVDKVMAERMAVMEQTMSDLQSKITEAGAADHGRATYNQGLPARDRDFNERLDKYTLVHAEKYTINDIDIIT